MSPAHGRGFTAPTDEAIAEKLAAFGPSATHQTLAVRIRPIIFTPFLLPPYKKPSNNPGRCQGMQLE